MTTRLPIRSFLLAGAMMIGAAPLSAQETPSRISWSPSYSGSCHDCSLVGRNMSGWNVSKASYPGADLTAANLRRTHAHGANFNGVQAAGADLRLGDYTAASIEAAILVRARMQGASFNSSKMTGIVLNSANLSDG